MTFVRSLLTLAVTCPCCKGLGTLRECFVGIISIRPKQITCPHCLGLGTVVEKDLVQ